MHCQPSLPVPPGALGVEKKGVCAHLMRSAGAAALLAKSKLSCSRIDALATR